MTICSNSHFLFVEIIIPLILIGLIYYFKLRKIFNKNRKQKIIAVGLSLLILIVLVVILSSLWISSGLGCSGPEFRGPEF